MKEIIVVEGRDDTRRLKEVLGVVDTIETRGSAINQETLELIKKAHEFRGVIVLCDPDFPGEKIRKTITQYIPTVKHAFLTVAEATPKHKGSLGVEHASDAAILRALNDVKSVQDYESQTPITKSFLMRIGLVGLNQSAKRREALAKKMGIGHVNGKQLEKRLNAFGYTPEQIMDTMAIVWEENYGTF
ncbi:ribonuclease M5 [Carnobacteriaceae bacterium zg-ZUI252]|nr:ribonuclease M5 [Carnobacteriaceae bacterium zg-ZUI252]MBS4770483.1 ribonuclease M5 [Carnobacteriaceae bacterium zg-ZUI240]QTU82824.1 ribonuclease M5 [Carnobacteriaceae bacterium zg-C25]